jgi:hypothetical protein
MFARIIIFPFVIVAAIVWAIIGLFFWIPMLAKSVTIFTFSVLANAIVNRPAASSARNLERAVVYYVNGFGIIFSTLGAHRFDEDHPEHEGETSGGLIVSIFSNLIMIFNAVVFASIFWLMFLIFIHHLGIINIPLVGYWEARLLPNLHF